MTTMRAHSAMVRPGRPAGPTGTGVPRLGMPGRGTRGVVFPFLGGRLSGSGPLSLREISTFRTPLSALAAGLRPHHLRKGHVALRVEGAELLDGHLTAVHSAGRCRVETRSGLR